MIDLVGKTVARVGWAGPLLWVCTEDGYSIHLYDAQIRLDGSDVQVGENLESGLAGRQIVQVSAGEGEFAVTFNPAILLCVESSDAETARVFKKGDPTTHWIYLDGTLRKDDG